MKKIRRILTIFILLIIYIYIYSIELIPNEMIVFAGETIPLKTILGLTVDNIDYLLQGETLQASSNLNTDHAANVSQLDVNVNLFNHFKVKEIAVEVVSKTKVIPLGSTVGMKLYTDGVLVVGMSAIEGEKPYENSGIQEGDRIIEIDNEKIDSTDELIDTVNHSNGNAIEIKYQREEETRTTSIKPAKTENDEYKLGLWVRDAAAGVGTITFYEPSSGKYAALGHGITDVDTSELIKIANGELVTTNIVNVVKGAKGEPGEIRGTIENSINLGKICKNTKHGIYGKLLDQSNIDLNVSSEMEVALRDEINTGKAEILCQLENDKVEKYEIEIQKLFKNNQENNKSMVIKITDDRLLEKTGGIIQGMSGAPIIQNGKFVGAVTHVLVNDPTVGYGVFGDIMIKELKEVN